MAFHPSGEQKANAELDDRSAQTAKLIDAIEEGKQGTIREIIEWVFDNAMRPPDRLNMDTCPSLGALGLLEWARRPANYGNFVMTLWSKLIPAKMQGDAEAKFQDDGRKVFELLDRFEASFARRHDE